MLTTLSAERGRAMPASKILVAAAAAAVLGLAACGTSQPTNAAEVTCGTGTHLMATHCVVDAPPTTTQAPTTTIAPPTTAPATTVPAPPVEVNVNINGPTVNAPVARPTSIPVAASYDATAVAPNVIEDGTHFGYLTAWNVTSFSFDRVDVLPDGSWKNTNPKVRTLPLPANTTGIPYVGMPIQVVVQNQHMMSITSVSTPTPTHILPEYNYLAGCTDDIPVDVANNLTDAMGIGRDELVLALDCTTGIGSAFQAHNAPDTEVQLFWSMELRQWSWTIADEQCGC